MVAELEAEALRRGYSDVYLTTGPRQPEAVRLYLRSGYEPLFDPSRPAEEIGIHAFRKALVTEGVSRMSRATAHPAGPAAAGSPAVATTATSHGRADAAATAASSTADASPTGAVLAASAAPAVDHGLKVVPVKHWGRWIASVVVAFVILQFLWSLATNPQWQWNVFAEYFLAPSVLESLVLTLQLTVIAGIVGFALGAVLAIFRLSKSPLLNAAAWWYIWFFRSVPLVVQILVVQPRLPLPDARTRHPFTTDFWLVEFPTTTLLSAFAAATIGLSLHQAAYSAEIIRAGILSVDQGQARGGRDARAAAPHPLLPITLPQAARAIVPNAFNEVIGLVKGTSVVFIVALPELFYTVQVIYNRNQRVIPMLLVAVVWYAIITTVL